MDRRRHDSRSYSPRDRRDYRDDRRRSPDRRRRSPPRRGDSYDRRDSYRRRDRDSYDRRDDRREEWRDGKREAGRRDENRSVSPVGSRGGSHTPRNRKEPEDAYRSRPRSHSKDSGYGKAERHGDDQNDRAKSPVNNDDRAQTDEREIENGRAGGDNPERQDRSPRDDGPAKVDENKD